MTDKQKEAIGILNRLHGQGPKTGDLLTDEEYYALMDFVIGDGHQQVINIPYTPFVPDTTPRIQPYYTTPPQDPLIPPYRVTCNKQD